MEIATQDRVNLWETDKYNISHNILYLVKTKKITLAELARQLNIPRPTLNNIVHQRVFEPNLAIVYRCANFLGVTLDQFIKHKLSDQLYVASKDGSSFSFSPKIPILKWQDAHKTIQTIDPASELLEWLDLERTVSYKNLYFALRSKSSYEPKFPANSFLIFDCSIVPTDTHYVLVHDKVKGKVSLMQYFYDGNNEYIVTLQGEKKTIFEPEQATFLGVLSYIKLILS